MYKFTYAFMAGFRQSETNRFNTDFIFRNSILESRPNSATTWFWQVELFEAKMNRKTRRSRKGKKKCHGEDWETALAVMCWSLLCLKNSGSGFGSSAPICVRCFQFERSIELVRYSQRISFSFPEDVRLLHSSGLPQLARAAPFWSEVSAVYISCWDLRVRPQCTSAYPLLSCNKNLLYDVHCRGQWLYFSLRLSLSFSHCSEFSPHSYKPKLLTPNPKA